METRLGVTGGNLCPGIEHGRVFAVEQVAAQGHAVWLAFLGKALEVDDLAELGLLLGLVLSVVRNLSEDELF